jgi:hypothetical protein
MDITFRSIAARPGAPSGGKGPSQRFVRPGRPSSGGERSAASCRRLAVALALYCFGRSQAAAENHVDYKFEYYAEESDRILVRTHSALFEQKLAPDVALKGAFVYDGISGATPTGGPPPAGSKQVPTVELDDTRLAGYVEPRFKFGRNTLAPQVAYSAEEDYESLGLSLNYLVDFNKRNTTLNLGVAHNVDRVTGFYLGNRWEDKTVTDMLAGLTQVLTPTTLFNATLTMGTASGYLADPYKGFRFTGYPDPEALFPEKRPGHRTKQILSTTLTQSLEPLDASPELTYRFYHDSHDILSHTVTLEWFQSLGPRLIVAPLVRYYHQSEAYFYRLSYDADPTYPQTPPVPLPQFYSADYRLSLFRSLTYGISLTFKVGRHMVFDAAYKRYDMVGLDGETPQSSYPTANIYTVGFRIFF